MTDDAVKTALERLKRLAIDKGDPKDIRIVLAHIAALEARAKEAEAFGHVFHTLPDGRLDFVAIREGSELGKLHRRAAALAAQVAGLREALELIDNSISAGVTETDGPARVKADGDTRIEDGFIVGQFAIQFELIMKCVQNVCRKALAAAPTAPAGKES